MSDDTQATEKAHQKGWIRRRCWWCAVTLRWWQINSCRRCKRALVAPYVGPPCRSRSRWNAEPDALRTPPGAPTDGAAE